MSFQKNIFYFLKEYNFSKRIISEKNLASNFSKNIFQDSPQRAVVVHLPSNDDEESEDTATVSVNVDVAFVKKPSATVETTAVSEQVRF